VRNPVRGWRSQRHLAPRQGLVAVGSAEVNVAAPALPQDKLRLGLGLMGLTFYLWVIHSYKLAAGDVAILMLGVGVLTRAGKVRFPGFMVAFGLFVLWSALSLAVTNDLTISTTALVDLVKLWIISFLVVNVIRTPAELRFLVVVWLGLFALYPI